MAHLHNIKWVGIFIWALSFTSILNPFSAVKVQAQDKCAQELAQAEEMYFAGEFDAAIDLLTGCLNKGGLTAEEQTRVYKLLALVYISKNDPARAKENVQKLLELAPNYQPDPNEDPPELIDMVQQIRQERERQEQIRQEQERKREEERRLQEQKLKEQQLEEQKPTPQPEQPIEPAPPPKKRSKKWLWIGLGTAALGGGAVAVLAGGGKGQVIPPLPEKLPDPPGSP
jgi:tetratricopeptide (TPR) repeat protein